MTLLKKFIPEAKEGYRRDSSIRTLSILGFSDSESEFLINDRYRRLCRSIAAQD